MTLALLGAAAAAASVRLDERQALLFQQTCARCHVQPGTGAPQVGDPAGWQERNAQGFERLFANTVNGVRGMPPLGTCGGCSEDDLRALVAFVAGLAPAATGEAP